jgi:hypothetical protein
LFIGNRLWLSNILKEHTNLFTEEIEIVCDFSKNPTFFPIPPYSNTKNVFQSSPLCASLVETITTSNTKEEKKKYKAVAQIELSFQYYCLVSLANLTRCVELVEAVARPVLNAPRFLNKLEFVRGLKFITLRIKKTYFRILVGVFACSEVVVCFPSESLVVMFSLLLVSLRLSALKRLVLRVREN